MTETNNVSGVVGDQLKSFVESIERLNEERAAIGADTSDKYKEAKGAGFDVKVLREIIRLRKLEASVRKEHEELVELYQRALGM